MEQKRPSLRFKCLVMDHDDTTVNSTATVHYPCFVEYMEKFFPDIHLTLEEYFTYNFDPGVIDMFTKICGMTWEQMLDEEAYWKEYVKHHVPKAYPGIREILLEQKKQGGKICVVSHSFKENILRDYRENDLPEPDLIYGWECAPEQRKPAIWPLEQIMKSLGLKPEEMLVVDDLKPGYDMAKAAGVPFAAAGWANDIEMIERFMRENCGSYFKTVKELYNYLFG
ncbi:MAG: HAD-IA family hydrolase [Clostridia bacterium]|nr:HAD-IA family hydrolase [Clostridia bacterium]